MGEPAVYPSSAVERAMKVQEVILRPIDGRLKWYQAAEILGISDRQMQRWKVRYERWGYDGLFDRPLAALAEAGAVGHRPAGADAVSGALLRLQRPALPREAPGDTRDPPLLHLG